MDSGLDDTFDILIPLTVGVLFGLVSRWLLGLKDSDHAERLISLDNTHI